MNENFAHNKEDNTLTISSFISNPHDHPAPLRQRESCVERSQLIFVYIPIIRLRVYD